MSNNASDATIDWVGGVEFDWRAGQTIPVRLVHGTGSVSVADTTLSVLSVQGVSLDPAFASDRLLYTAEVDAATETVTVSATAADTEATVGFLPETDADPDAAGHQVSVELGETLITATVSANDASKTYRILMTRPDAGASVTVAFADATNTAAEGNVTNVTVQLSADPPQETVIPLSAKAEGGAEAADSVFRRR